MAQQRLPPAGKRNIGRDLTLTGLHVIDLDHASSSPVISDLHSEYSSASTHSCGSSISPATGHSVQFITQDADVPTGAPINYPVNQFPVPDRGDSSHMGPSPASLLPTTPITIGGSTQSDDPVLQISGAGHWFLEGWIGDHSVEFLVDSGSSVTAMSNSFYQTLVRTGSPLGVLEHTARTLRSANGCNRDSLTVWYRSWDYRRNFP